MVAWLLTLAAVAVSLVGAARRRPPAWAAVLLGGGLPLVTNLVYDHELALGLHAGLAAAGAAGGLLLHRQLPSFGPGPGPARLLPWACQAGWAAGLLLVQHAERSWSLGRLSVALGAYVALGALWTGYALARAARPHLAEVVLDALGQANLLGPREPDDGEATPAPVAAPAPALAAGALVATAVPVATAPAPAPAAAPAPAPAPWIATHEVPPGGLDCRVAPDPGAAVIAQLARGTPVRVADRRGDWARVDAANGWSAWVDGRRLV